MRYSIGLGRTGTSGQWYLPGTDTMHLPSPPADAQPPEPGALEDVSDGSGGDALLLHGLVAASGRPDAASGLVLDVMGAWNSVKNASVQADHAGWVTLSGFVHTDVSLGDGGDSFVDLHGAKRGNVLTGDGADTVTIEATSNVWAWVNEFRVATGSGGDTVVVRPLDLASAAAADPTFAATSDGAGAFAAADSKTTVFADLGAGDDRFFALGESRDVVAGGAGDDVIRAGHGDDQLAGGAGRDLFLFTAGDGADTILDFRPGEDRIGLGLSPAETMALLDAAIEADGATTLVHGADSVVLLGVAKAQLAPTDLF